MAQQAAPYVGNKTPAYGVFIVKAVHAQSEVIN
jgi:hypothetical protein